MTAPPKCRFLPYFHDMKHAIAGICGIILSRKPVGGVMTPPYGVYRKGCFYHTPSGGPSSRFCQHGGKEKGQLLPGEGPVLPLGQPQIR